MYNIVFSHSFVYTSLSSSLLWPFSRDDISKQQQMSCLAPLLRVCFISRPSHCVLFQLFGLRTSRSSAIPGHTISTSSCDVFNRDFCGSNYFWLPETLRALLSPAILPT